MNRIKVNFKSSFTEYKGRHLEIRLSGSQIRFYEVNGKSEKCLPRETVLFLVGKKRIAKNKMIMQALRLDKSIFD